MAYDEFRVVSSGIHKEIKEERLLLGGRLRYYQNVEENISEEVDQIEERMRKLLLERERQSLEVQKKVEKILEESKRYELLNDRRRSSLLKERDRIIKHHEDAPRMIEELEMKLNGLESKKRKLMVGPLKGKLGKLQDELKKMGVFI